MRIGTEKIIRCFPGFSLAWQNSRCNQFGPVPVR
jgi:hypothetical protein